MFLRLHRVLGLSAALALLPLSGAWAQEQDNGDAEELEEIEVIAVTPFSGSTVNIETYPANVQKVTAEFIQESQTTNIVNFLNQELGSVHVNDAVNNPFQPDLKYRGYTASPLLGLPQGISVYQDGVRINEPFGDTVNFDLIPSAAIASIALIPGSNPLFGLNTLGGALNIQTKTGFSHPGTTAELYGGDFGRYGGFASYGGYEGDSAWFLLAQGVQEDGWRDFSDSEVQQLFAKFSNVSATGETHFSITAANNTLRGNGAIPRELAEVEGRDAIFTYPDETSPELLMFNLRGVNDFSPNVSLAWGGYYRSNEITTFNGDGSEFMQCEPPDEDPMFLCSEEINDMGDEVQEVVENVNGDPVPFDPTVGLYGTENTSSLDQDGYGISLQLRTPGLAGGTLISGVTYDAAESEFSSAQQIAELDADRGTQPLGIFTAEAVTRVTAENSNIGIFALHRMPLGEAVTWTLGGRYNWTNVELIDRTPAFAREPGASLDGDHDFKRLNLMTGLAWQVTGGLTLFGSVGQSSRAPSPLELSCANPDAPCRLPNGFVDDPPLEAVVATTYEIGARGESETFHWSVALFSATNANDIIFQAVNTFESFFDNVGDTRRQGIETGMQWQILPTLLLSANYTYLEAEFRDGFLVSSPNHPVRVPAGGGETEPAPRTQVVEAGDRIPLIPEHIFSLGVDWAVTDQLDLGLDLEGNSEQIYRGDESNTDPEQIDGFAILNAHAVYWFTEAFSVFVRGSNLLDDEYATFGVYGEASEVLQDPRYEDAYRFFGPGAPRAFWAGVRLEL